VTHILIDIVLVGAVAFSAARRIGRRRAITPTSVPEVRPEQGATTSVRREPPETARAKQTESATASIQTPTSPGFPQYLLGARRAGESGDRMAETLEMMSGPGICTPNSR
jgi:hypothetical protein